MVVPPPALTLTVRGDVWMHVCVCIECVYVVRFAAPCLPWRFRPLLIRPCSSSPPWLACFPLLLSSESSVPSACACCACCSGVWMLQGDHAAAAEQGGEAAEAGAADQGWDAAAAREEQQQEEQQQAAAATATLAAATARHGTTAAVTGGARAAATPADLLQGLPDDDQLPGGVGERADAAPPVTHAAAAAVELLLPCPSLLLSSCCVPRPWRPQHSLHSVRPRCLCPHSLGCHPPAPAPCALLRLSINTRPALPLPPLL